MNFVSSLPKKIVCLSIENLQKEGLRFSIDTIARTLKISEKTVYRYFADKEALARARPVGRIVSFSRTQK